MHASLLLEPSTSEYVPEVQLMHSRLPSSEENFPAGHDEQVRLLVAPTAAEYVPAMQLLHVALLSDPDTEE
jgi:hypothetical protein